MQVKTIEEGLNPLYIAEGFLTANCGCGAHGKSRLACLNPLYIAEGFLTIFDDYPYIIRPMSLNPLYIAEGFLTGNIKDPDKIAAKVAS